MDDVSTQLAPLRDEVLARIQNRARWPAVQRVYHPNQAWTGLGGVKVGGHRASSASTVTILTYL